MPKGKSLVGKWGSGIRERAFSTRITLEGGKEGAGSDRKRMSGLGRKADMELCGFLNIAFAECYLVGQWGESNDISYGRSRGENLRGKKQPRRNEPDSWDVGHGHEN